MESQITMKEGQGVVYRAATPSISPYFLSRRSGKNTTAWVFPGLHSSLEMVSANAMRDRWPPADVMVSYTASPQAVGTRRPGLSYIHGTLLSENLPQSK